MLLALAAVAATAVLAGVLVAVPGISPLASGLPGLLLVGWTVLYLVSVRRATGLIPLRSLAFGAGWEALLFNGVLGAVGLAMVVPMCLPSRWRGSRTRGTATGDGNAQSTGDRGSQAPPPARGLWEPARASRRTTASAATGSFTAQQDEVAAESAGTTDPAWEVGPHGNVWATGPFQAESDPAGAGTEPFPRRPIQTTGPIRLYPPRER